MTVRVAHVRLYALLVLGGLLVHELRYALAFGDEAEHVLNATGHGYLSWAGPVFGTAMALVFSALVLRAAASAPGAPTRQVRLRRLWPVASVALLAIFAGQEALEGVFAAHHPDGLAAVLGNGGWIAVPASVVVGGGVALMVRVTSGVAAPAMGWLPGTELRLVEPACSKTVHRGALAAGLARHLAGRGPPQPA